MITRPCSKSRLWPCAKSVLQGNDIKSIFQREDYGTMRNLWKAHYAERMENDTKQERGLWASR